jgi:hypothetical protein
MATYKVIQDIEAEDKFVGPLTLKQFIFLIVGLFFGYLNIFAYTRGFAWAIAVFLPPALFCIFMAFPWSINQPTDVWVLAKIRFFFKPKVRTWNQAGIQELVTITAPKKIEKQLTKNFTEKEFTSRLKALAETIDSRGWAVKHASFTEALIGLDPLSDRLVSPDILPRHVPVENVESMSDMMDKTNVDGMLSENDDLKKSQVLEKMDRVRQGEPIESVDRPAIIISPPSEHISGPLLSEDEATLSEQVRIKRTAGDVAYNNMSKVATGGGKQAVSHAQTDDDDSDDTSTQNKNKKAGNSKTEIKKAQASVTEQISPDILGLAQNNDLNVATIARQAKNDKPDDGEVVIKLH